MSVFDLQHAEALFAAKLLHAFLECSDTMQAGIQDMVAIINDPEADEDDRFSAVATLADVLFPNPYKGKLGMDLAESERDAAGEFDDLQKAVDQMDNEETTFAQRLAIAMKSRGLTQAALADRIGIGQPAVSNMLKRQCRPQRRTIEKLSLALEIEPQELWPGFAAHD